MTLGECDSCLKRNVPLRRTFVTGIETWACPSCFGEETVECTRCGVDVKTEHIGDANRCLDRRCPLQPRETP